MLCMKIKCTKLRTKGGCCECAALFHSLEIVQSADVLQTCDNNSSATVISWTLAIYSIARFLLKSKLLYSPGLEIAVDWSLFLSLLLRQILSWCKMMQLYAHEFFLQTNCSMKASKQLENPEAAFLPQNKNKFFCSSQCVHSPEGGI